MAKETATATATVDLKELAAALQHAHMVNVNGGAGADAGVEMPLHAEQTNNAAAASLTSTEGVAMHSKERHLPTQLLSELPPEAPQQRHQLLRPSASKRRAQVEGATGI
jgi:hypothetical protein